VIPAPFTHVRVSSTKEASDALDHYGDDAKLLAGGHSLIPLMKLRLATPSVLIDIMRIQELKGIRRENGNIVIGALTNHVEIERSPIVQQYAPLIAAAAAYVGDPQVRNRGTIGGSVAHGDSASDLSGALLAANATFRVYKHCFHAQFPFSKPYEREILKVIGFRVTSFEKITFPPFICRTNRQANNLPKPSMPEIV